MKEGVIKMVTTFEMDYYNKNGRNSQNTSIDDYNCGGYALGTFNWYLPYESYEESTWALHFEHNMSVNEIAHYYENYLLSDFFEIIRPIKSTDELAENEKAIAFRVGIDDFHFCVYRKDIGWYHKPGRNTIRRITTEEVFADHWESPDGFVIYNSELILFAMKED